MSFVTLLGRIMPKRLRKSVKKMIGYSTFTMNSDEFLGWSVVLGIVCGFLVSVLVGTNYEIPPLALFGGSFAVIELLVYVWLSLNISGKASQVDSVLPDALQLMSSNIRAGLTTDKALILAARPEFGALEQEIRRVGKETMAGKGLAESLMKMTLNINSTSLSRTIELIVHSLKSGGQLADLLDQTADDIRDQQIIQKEISASVLMYVLFIFIAIALGAPALFAMSSFLVELLAGNMNMIAEQMPANFDSMGSMPISMTGVSVDPEFIRMYSYISMSVSCVMGSMIMGLILKGEEKEGFKYMPVLLVIALVLYTLGSWVLENTLGGMMMV